MAHNASMALTTMHGIRIVADRYNPALHASCPCGKEWITTGHGNVIRASEDYRAHRETCGRTDTLTTAMPAVMTTVEQTVIEVAA